MFDFIKPIFYIRLSPYRLTVRNVRSGASVSALPEIAVSRGPKGQLLGAGEDAAPYRSSKSARVSNPFAHPRSLVSDFTLGEQVIKAFVAKLQKTSFMLPARIVLHPQGEPAGGFTQIEVRALHEMARGAGASAVTVWQGPELTDAQVLEHDYPASGQVLE